MRWENENGPLQVNDELSLHVLDMHQGKVANGNVGYISILTNENGQKLIGKVSLGNMFDNMGHKVDDLALEFAAFEQIDQKAEPHPNVAKAYGIATVRDELGVATRMMIMDHIDGPTGEIFFDDLRRSWKHGKITSEEYWGVVQFIFRRLLDAAGHLGKAEVVHNDINLENFMIHAKTGEPILIDLGLWSHHGARHVEGSFPFRSDDDCSKGGVDERSDVFMVVASLIAAVEGFELVKGADGASEPNFHPKRGLKETREARLNAQGQAEHVPATFSTPTAYTNFTRDGLEEDKEKRLPPTAEPGSSEASPSARAKMLAFLNDSMLDEDDEKAMEKIRATIQKVIATGAEEQAKPANERWKKSAPKVSFDRKEETRLNVLAFELSPTLARLARLSSLARTDSSLRSHLDATVPGRWQELVNDAARVAPVLKMEGNRFDLIAKLVGDMPARDPVQKSGVDADGVRKVLELSDNEERWREVASLVMNALSDQHLLAIRTYAEDAQAFLHKVSMIKGIPRSDLSRLAEITEPVRIKADIARRLVEIEDVNVAASEAVPSMKVKVAKKTSGSGMEDINRMLARHRAWQSLKKDITCIDKDALN